MYANILSHRHLYVEMLCKIRDIKLTAFVKTGGLKERL